MIRRLIILLLIVGCTTEPEDCAGVEGGTAELDCFGVCGGVAIKDDCGLCTGGTTGLIANYLKDCAGVCGGAIELDECGVCGGDSSTCEGLWNVYYDVDVPIAGFQFQVNGGNIINASGGAATEAGLSVSNSSSTVVAFSLSGNTIPSGTGTLISLDMEGDSNSFCISNLVLSDIGGNVIPAIIVNCNTIKYSDN